jgi:hypothetical protein
LALQGFHSFKVFVVYQSCVRRIRAAFRSIVAGEDDEDNAIVGLRLISGSFLFMINNYNEELHINTKRSYGFNMVSVLLIWHGIYSVMLQLISYIYLQIVFPCLRRSTICVSMGDHNHSIPVARTQPML